MCLAIPGKVVEIDKEGNCVVDYVVEKRTAKIFTDDVGVGDYVIVSNKVVVMKIPEEQAVDYLNAIKGI
jgi:hydrogenase maturation factor